MGGSVVVERLGKRFDRNRSRRSAWRGGDEGRFWALRDVSVTVGPGCALGVVGRNGAGKSTLLRLIGGVSAPDAGRVTVTGRVGAILDVGAGLSDEMTGRENAHIAGVIAGMTRAELRRRFDAIVAFSELEEFIDSPLRTYSSGMRMRLAFSVAVHADPEVLLVDEALAVGDLAFQRKCLHRLAEVKEAGCATLLVSHDMSQLRALCDELLFLERGRCAGLGSTAEIAALYEGAPPPAAVPPDGEAAPDARAAEARVTLLNGAGRRANSILSGAGLVIEIALREGGSGRLTVTTGLERADGALCFETSVDLSADAARLRLTIDRLDLVPGDYVVTTRVDGDDRADGPRQQAALTVVGPHGGSGIVAPPVQWQVMAAA